MLILVNLKEANRRTKEIKILSEIKKLAKQKLELISKRIYCKN